MNWWGQSLYSFIYNSYSKLINISAKMCFVMSTFCNYSTEQVNTSHIELFGVFTSYRYK